MEKFVLDKFQNPSNENSVVYGWVWNSPISKETIDKQLTCYFEAGITGIYILPEPYDFRPEQMRTFLHPQYLTESYFDMVEYAFEKAKKIGMHLWIYDEGGWPSGGACGNTARENPSAVETVLKKRDKTIKKGETYTVNENVVAFIGISRINNSFTANEDTEICEYFCEKETDNRPCRVDSTNASVIDTFINNTYEKYYERFKNSFGNDISLIFTDEPSVIGGLVPENLFENFKEKYGYDLTDYLPVLLDVELAKTKEQMMARIHYGKLVGELFYENYCKKLAKWCQSHNIKLGGHLNVDNRADGGAPDRPDKHGGQIYYSLLHALSAFDVPGVDVIWQQIRYPYGKISPIKEGYPFYPRIASSAAHQTGKKRALTESFGAFGDALTADEMRYTLNYQAIRGINTFSILALSSTDERTGALVERPIFTPSKPGFYNLKHFNTYFRRLSYLLCLGDVVCDTALFQPNADFFANEEIRLSACQSFEREGCELESKNIYFDIIDEYAIDDAELTPDGLKLGGALYKHITVPECKFISKETAKKIAPFTGKGEPLLKVSSPYLRVMARKVENGCLWFIFNEGEDRVEETLDIPARNLYRLNLQCGAVYSAKTADISLCCGEIAVFFASDDILPCDSDKIEYSIEVKDFKKIKAKRFVIDRIGVKMADCDINAILEKDFSGEITFAAQYELPEVPSENDSYRLVLKDTAASASAAVNGKKVADFGMTPMIAVISGSLLSKSGVLEITVCNTAADEILAKREVINTFPKAEIGPYCEMTYAFEEARPALKFGKVVIEKII